MSRLQEFITKLGRVIIHYAETQTKLTYNTEEILAKPHKQLIEELTNLIHETVKFQARRSSLDYFIYVINEVKPLIEKDTPLTELESFLIKEVLQNFLITLFELLDISKNTEVQLKYNNIEVPALRFISKAWTIHRENVPSEMGKTVTQYLVNYISAKTSDGVALYVQTIIDEHQSILLVPLLNQQIQQLKEEKNALNLSLEAVLNTNQQLEQSLSLERENNQKIEQKIALLETTELVEKEDKAAKEKTITQLTSQLEKQKTALQSAHDEISLLKIKQDESKTKNTRLEEENNQLKANPPLASGRPGIYSSLGFFPMTQNLFGRMPLSNTSPESTNNTPPRSPSLNNLNNVE